MARIGRGVLLGALALACASTPNFRTFHYQVTNDTREVSPGHWAGPWEHRGVCVQNVGTKDEEAGVFTVTGTFDGQWTSPTTMSSCSAKAVATCVYPDGSSHTDEANITCKLGPNGKLVNEGHGVVVGGTGRFEGIQGTMTIVSARQLAAPPGELNYDVGDFKYTLPKR
jgi:hypothetical protein